MRRRSPTLILGGILTAALLLVALTAPLLAPYDPDEQVDPAVSSFRPPGTRLAAVHLAERGWRLAERVERTREGLRIERLGRTEEVPASAVLNLTSSGVADTRFFLLGTDLFGRDLLSRVIYGTRVSLAVGLMALAFALTLGLTVGSAAALGGRVVDMVLMRTVDALLAFPSLFLMIALAAFFRPGEGAIVLLLGATSWMGISRLTRSELLILKQKDFVLAARSIGQRPLAILFRHLLPNALTPVVIQATLLIGNLVLVESSLSFLGMGIQPPTPSWGNMVATGRDALSRGWWVSAFPGAALALSVIAFNLLGEGLRDALDPRESRQVFPLDTGGTGREGGATLPAQ